MSKLADVHSDNKGGLATETRGLRALSTIQ